MMNKEKFDKIIQRLMNKEIEITHLLNHLNQTQLETSFQLTNGSPTIEDKPIENVLLDKEINHDFILYFMNLVHAEGNHFLPIRPNPQNVMSPNKNILNLSHFSNAAEMTGSIAASLATTAITTPTTEPKRLYPRSIKHQANNSPRANVFQNSFESHSSVCSTPRQFNNGNTGGGGGTRLTRNYSSLSCQSSPGIDYSPRNNQSYTGGRNQHPVRHTLFDYIASPVKSPNENSRGIISPLAHPQPQHPAPTGQASESFSSRLREVSSGVVFNNSVTAWPTVMSSRGSSSKFNTPVKSTTISSAMIKSSNEEELKVAPNNENIVEMDFEVENKEAVAKELCFECVEKSLEKNDIQRLSILAHFYSQLILRNLTLTVNTELFFLFQLITLNPNENKLGNHPDDLKLFNSIEFCIYFAIKSIVYLESVLKHLKNSTLVELTENIHMKNFLNELQTLSKSNTYHLAPQEIKQKSKMVFLELKVVPFNAETSTIGNYQDKNSFVSFKNQRDEFYDILWKWETNHKLETWSFYEECGKRIRGLIWENKNTANFLLFIKLFVDQLVLMCKDDKLLIDNKNEELLGMETSRLKLDDPLKIKKLNARMITPNTHYGPIPEPKFIGYQEFFKDFIDLSSCPAFHQCLKDFISNEIESIHKEIPELENDDENENAIDKEMLEDMMLKLRVLGKFLGYLHFQPYHHIIGNINSSLDMVSIRNNKMIPLNLESYIQRAIAKSHLIMTIPFIIEFLSMMDENALLIDSIHASISLLNVIYNSKFMSLSSTEFTRDKFLLLLNISWLFQLKKIDHNQLKPKQITLNEETKRGLDNVSFVTPLVLHFCCPYLDELQRLLTKFSTGVKKGCQKIRELSHLHPLQMKKENLMDTALDKNQIQIQLINQFLFLRPSHRRLIEFASDLVVKNFLKQYRINKPANDNSSVDSQKSNKNKYKLECIAAGKEYFGPKIETLIDSSLCESECALVVEKSKQICMYKSVEKLKAWINSHLKSDSEKPGSNNQDVDILENYFTQMPNNTVSENIQIKNILLGSSSKSTSDIYKDIKEAAKIIVSKSREFSEIEKTINKLIDDILEYFSTNKNSESKLLRPIKEYIGQMLCEIIMYYVLNNHQQPVKTETVEKCFDLIRMLFSGSEEKLKVMFHCSRNSYLLQNKINSSVLTDNYEILIKIGGNEIDLRKK